MIDDPDPVLYSVMVVQPQDLRTTRTERYGYVSVMGTDAETGERLRFSVRKQDMTNFLHTIKHTGKANQVSVPDYAFIGEE